MEKDSSRRVPRATINAHIDIRRPGDHRYNVQIHDLSPDGCRVETPVTVNPGDSVFIILPGIESIEGIVRWKKEWIIGVEFIRPMYPAVFEMIRSKME